LLLVADTKENEIASLIRPWVQSPAQKKKEKKKSHRRQRRTLYNDKHSNK
jgi:hypothetical protein